MRTCRIIAVGRIKRSQAYLKQGLQLYEQRLSKWLTIEWVEIPEPSGQMSSEEQRQREAKAIKAALLPNITTIALNNTGVMLSTESLAQWLLMDQLPSPKLPNVGHWQTFQLIIGGAYGLSNELLQQDVHGQWSLSALTFPHLLVRLLIMEQLYRVFSLQAGEPYHK